MGSEMCIRDSHHYHNRYRLQKKSPNCPRVVRFYIENTRRDFSTHCIEPSHRGIARCAASAAKEATRFFSSSIDPVYVSTKAYHQQKSSFKCSRTTFLLVLVGEEGKSWTALWNCVRFFFSSRRRHTRCREVSWARRCV